MEIFVDNNLTNDNSLYEEQVRRSNGHGHDNKQGMSNRIAIHPINRQFRKNLARSTCIQRNLFARCRGIRGL